MRSTLVLITCITFLTTSACAHPRPDSASQRATRDASASEMRQPVTAWGKSVAGAVEVDHVYIVTRPGAPEAAVLRAAGFQVPERRSRHTGTGSSSATIIFENAYLELLYADSTVSDSANSPTDRAYWYRVFDWRASGASPIGIGLRRPVGGPDSLPFPTERMTPQLWMRAGTEIRLLTSTADSLAPSVFVVPRYLALTGWIAEAQRDTAFAATLQHPLGVRRLTGVRVVVTHPDGIPSNVRALAASGVLQVETGADALVELTFDGGRRGATKDFRPALPLLIRY